MYKIVYNNDIVMQLQLYAERGNPNIVLQDTYDAKAYNKKSLIALTQANNQRIQNVIICTAIFVFLFSFVIFLLTFCALCFSTDHKSLTESRWVKEIKTNLETVISLSVVSFIVNIYIFSLTASAVGFWRNRLDDELNLFHTIDTLKSQNIASVSIAVVLDILCLILLLIITVISVIIYKQIILVNYKEYVPVILSLTVLCPLFCIITHSPYIIVAYLNDGSHASSIFIYYTILVYVFFGFTRLFVHWCRQAILKQEKNNGNPGSTEKKTGTLQTETPSTQETSAGNVNQHAGTQRQSASHSEPHPSNGHTTPSSFTQVTPPSNHQTENPSSEPHPSNGHTTPSSSCGCHRRILTLIALAIGTLLFLLGLVVLITCYLVLIPINRAISDAPNQLLSIYQSGGFLIGSFIVYKVVAYFYNKNAE